MPDHWRKSAAVDPENIKYAGFHPTTAEKKIVQEIRAKQSDGLPLMPEHKQ
jgi:hypothetical protein